MLLVLLLAAALAAPDGGTGAGPKDAPGAVGTPASDGQPAAEGTAAPAPDATARPTAAPAAEPWEAAVTRAVGAPDHPEARLVALREAMLATAGNDDRRLRLRAVVPVVTTMAEGAPLSTDARVAVLRAALDGGTDAGLAALAEAEAAAAADPAAAEADAWIAPLLDALVATRTNAEADALLDDAEEAHAAAPVARERVAAARLLVDTLPESDNARRANARPYLARAFSRRSADRADAISLASGFDGQIELVRLGVRDPADFQRANELTVVDAYWFACASRRSPPRWRHVPASVTADAGRKADHRAHAYAREQCMAEEYLSYEASWTIALGGEPALGVEPLLRTPFRDALDDCRNAEVLIEIDYSAAINGAPAQVAITAPAPSRPPDCLSRAAAEEQIAHANAELARRVAEVSGK